MKKRTSDKFWFPWWPDKWIFGSVRIECTPAERGIWVDLLSLASKDDGHIRANEDTPYPLQQLAGMLIIPENDLDDAISKFIEKEKLTKTKTGTLYVTKWEKYQFSDRHKRRIEGEMSVETDTTPNNKDAYNILNKNTLNNKILDNNTEILNLLSKVKNYPFNKEKDLEFIKGLKIEFPDVDILEKIKQVYANWLDRPLLKKSRPRVQIRKWVSNEHKWQQEAQVQKKVGKTRPEDNLPIPYKDWQQIACELLDRGYDNEMVMKFNYKATKLFPKIKLQWEQSDHKPETFIRLVEGV